MKKVVVYLGLLISSCTAGVNLESVDYDHLFNDSNSKVWLVNKVMVENAVISPSNDQDKDVMIFYNSWNLDYLAMKDITRKAPRKADYFLDSDARTMRIEFADKQVWDLDLIYLTEDSILLEPRDGSDIKMAIQLKPFPEL